MRPGNQAVVASDDLLPILRRADAVVHLAGSSSPRGGPRSLGPPTARRARPTRVKWPTWSGAGTTSSKDSRTSAWTAYAPGPPLSGSRVGGANAVRRPVRAEQADTSVFAAGTASHPGLRMDSIDLTDAIRRGVLRPGSGSFHVATEPVVGAGRTGPSGAGGRRRSPAVNGPRRPASGWGPGAKPATDGCPVRPICRGYDPLVVSFADSLLRTRSGFGARAR